MPNWCENDLVIQGKEEELQKFKQYVSSERSQFDFNKMIPYPEEYAVADEAARIWEENRGNKNWADRPKDGFNMGGYQWCVDNWGTKWWIPDVDIIYASNKISYFFSTAWAPPEPIIKHLIEKFPKLKISLKYYEAGGGFRGVLNGARGKVTKEATYKYAGNRGG